jgi:hypothetical protein
MRMNARATLVTAVAVLVAGSCHAAEEADLARATQNPVSDLISVPFQNNTNFNVGPFDRTQNILNIQPVIPVRVGEWNLINRTIAPVIYQPIGENDDEFGLGDINHTTFFSPAKPGKLIWGLGPIGEVQRGTFRSGLDHEGSLGFRRPGQQSLVLCGRARPR